MQTTFHSELAAIARVHFSTNFTFTVDKHPHRGGRGVNDDICCIKGRLPRALGYVTRPGMASSVGMS